jgi:PIN domain nuclease of toxin-antitoxin system
MILLDTHVVIWLMTSPERVSTAAAEAIATFGEKGIRPGVSAATVYELVYAGRRGRLQLHVSEAALLAKLRQWFELVPISEVIALEAASLPDEFHGNPMDRLIAATALVDGRTLLTADRKLLAANVCKTLW